MVAAQRPLGTPFGPFTTAEEVAGDIDLSGKVAVVTGGASNLGQETARVLAARGAKVIVPARDAENAKRSLSYIPGLEVSAMDLLDPPSIYRFADDILGRYPSLDLLILSAGVMATPLFRDLYGNEGQFATNHLGHFRLTTELWPALRSAATARVVVLSSRGHQLGGFDLNDLNFRLRPYDKWLAYGQAKTANALFSVALDTRGRDHGIRAFSVHPGSILGPLARYLTHDEIDAFGALNADGTAVVDPLRDMKTPEQGAATTIWCATAQALRDKGGVYCEDCDIAAVEVEGNFGVRPFAVDRDMAENLWRESVRFTGRDLPAEL
ncbi:SDR family NAD(P)-dependent oxidoreductase [Sphingomonas sp. MAH-20]|uniref:SDR family NAD(P)-dependent oxidoreductase n=1 Tax=Sphingomonas horti TaxID=2682842 RepID=A0A6I4IXA3_9SPHN|nr:SDR family NAD(P)-dependent oxidoreductase [Sphingomonas sp. CGMCC 1.13658]MVO76822.1 SDR family NAD(P)-dependent oxidoreductase [Sphingomonas horti]